MQLGKPITDVKPVMLPLLWEFKSYEEERNLDIAGWGFRQSSI